MDTSKIIKGIVNGRNYTVTSPIVKEDYGIVLKIEGVELPPTYQVDFSNSENSGTSVTMIGNADGVLIPRQFISTGKDVFAFLYHVGEDYGRTVYKFRIPNKLRPDRTNEEPTPEEQSTIDQAISALNSAVEQTAQDKADADASAQSASQSAENASARATMAQNYADNAHGYANLASDHARTASQSALDAQVSASQAEQSAQSASQSAQTASEKADSITGLTAQATTLPSGSSASASYDAQTGVMSFGIPKGKDGTDGIDGDDGYSPTANVSKTGKTATITITDKDGTTSAQVEDGTDGTDGVSPTVSITPITGGHRIAITDADGTETADVMDGDDYILTEEDKEEIADMVEVPSDWLKAFPTDTASGAVASFSDGADNIPLKSLIVNIDPVQDTSSGDPSPENICPISGWTQVDVNHSDADMTNPTTITIDLGQTVYGGHLDVLTGELVVDRAMVDLGTLDWMLYSVTQGNLFRNSMPAMVATPSDGVIRAICSNYKVVKQTLRTNATISSGVSTYNVDIIDNDYSDVDTFKSAMSGVQLCYELATPIEIQLSANQINSLLGVNNIWADSGDTALEYRADPDLYIQRKMPEVPVDDVQINGQSIVSDGVANVPTASASRFGAVKIGDGLQVLSSGAVATSHATPSTVKAGTADYAPLVPSVQNHAVFYGLAKVAGVDMSTSSNALGRYTDEAKVAIQKMLGVYEVPYRIVKTIEISQEQTKIYINADEAGNPLSLTEVIVFIDTIATGNGSGYITVNNGDAVLTSAEFSTKPFVSIGNAYYSTSRPAMAHLWISGGRFFGQACENATSGTQRATVTTTVNAFGLFECDAINELLLYSPNSHRMMSGTIIIIGR